MSTRRIPKRVAYAAPLAVAALAIGGIAFAVEAHNGSPEAGTNAHTGDPVSYAGNADAAAKSLTPADANAQVLKGLADLPTVEGISAVPDTSGGTAVSVKLSQNDDDVPSTWAAGIALGAYAELTRTDQSVINDEVTQAEATGPGKDGSTVTTPLGVGAVRLGQTFGSPTDAALKAQVDSVAKTFGLTVSSVQVVHPLESALEVTFVVPDDTKIDWTIDQLRAALVGQTPDVEGVLIELNSPTGAPLLRSGVAYRTGDGGLWFAAGQDDRFGALHGGTPAG